MSVLENGVRGHLSELFTKTVWKNHAYFRIHCSTYSLKVKVIRILWPYRLVIVDRAVLCHLRVNTRRCGRGGWGSRPYPGGRALWHKKGGVGPPQFDAVVGHSSKNLGVWLWAVFQLQTDALIFERYEILRQIQPRFSLIPLTDCNCPFWRGFLPNQKINLPLQMVEFVREKEGTFEKTGWYVFDLVDARQLTSNFSAL